ncbi:heat shock protein Hsp20 [Rhodococcus opacus RKJ300 = JCM 13270]|uniref:Heat shock protein Hsp20 n=1 Tax=Rhodococcus opacus RKJ300 = JCM 13270 TaxID=1165867 RepID=I0WNF6_RHOOP|nr:heat shock protein Hsp20 [Rhodococcus opacus RKJ300 = JCM 13270]
MPPWTSLEGHMIRVEEHLDKGRYTLRAELPGVDPATDVDISVHDGHMTIKAERTEQHKEGVHPDLPGNSARRNRSPRHPKRAVSERNCSSRRRLRTSAVLSSPASRVAVHPRVVSGSAIDADGTTDGSSPAGAPVPARLVRSDGRKPTVLPAMPALSTAGRVVPRPGRRTPRPTVGPARPTAEATPASGSPAPRRAQVLR